MGAIAISVLVSGSVYSLVALGFALAFRVSGVYNMAYGGLLVVAAYLSYAFARVFSLSPWLSAALAVLLAGGLGYLIEARLIRKARAAGFSAADLLILTWLGLVVIGNGLALAFSESSIYMGPARVAEGLLVFGAHVSPYQLLAMGISLAVGALFYAIGHRTSAGRYVAAVGDDAKLAASYGLNVGKIVSLNALAAALLSSGAGVLLNYIERIDPYLGLRFSVIAIVATLVGIRAGPGGAVLGAFLLALLEALVLYLVSPALRNTLVYLALFLVVLWNHRSAAVTPVT